MSNIVKVICPGCGQYLRLPDVPGLKDMVVECPACHYRAAGAVYLNGCTNASRDRGGNNENIGLRDDRPTRLIDQGKAPLQCQLRVMTTGETFDLHEGSNTIGRRANSDTADIQISNDMYMSRKHIIIDVVKQRNTLEYHLVEIGSKNITKLNGKAINRGDILILNPGDVMTLGTTEVRLEVIDNERTRLIN